MRGIRDTQINNNVDSEDYGGGRSAGYGETGCVGKLWRRGLRG